MLKTEDLEPVTVEFDSKSANTISGVELKLNGQEISRFCRSFSLHAEPGQITSVTLELFPRKGFSLSLPASVRIAVSLIEPDSELVEELTPTGKRWFVRTRE